jgi:hypothetical protein
VNMARPTRIRAVGIVLPVHNEEDLLGSALEALDHAVDAIPTPLVVRVAVVLDQCQDSSERIARQWACHRSALVLSGSYRNVGASRRAGCAALLSQWHHRFDPRSIWLATTDADSRVPVQWLRSQLSAHRSGIDFWAGRVRVGDWSVHSDWTQNTWTANYKAEGDPVHGASLGFGAHAYLRLGGFRELPSGEDRDLYCRAQAANLRILHDTQAMVDTSARRRARAPLGFAHALNTLADAELTATA